MSKAEQRAFEAYPQKVTKQKRYSKRVQSEKIDVCQPVRTIYIKGYHQAEKDLALTHKDVASLFVIATTITRENTTPMTDEEFYQKVLKRFNKLKESNTNQ